MPRYLCSILILIFGTFISPDNLFSQNSKTVLKQYWFDYNYSYAWKPQFDLYGDGGFRWISPIRSYRFLVRPSIRYVPPNEIYEVHAGLGLFYTGIKDNLDLLEIRPFQGFRLNWPRIKKQVFHNYIRLEERWFTDIGDGGDNKFDLRWRWQLSTTIAFKREGFDRYFFFPLAGELFGSTNNQLRKLQDVLRLTMGAGYAFSGEWTGQFEFILQRSRDPVEQDLDNSDLIFRFRVFHKIPSKGVLKELFEEIK